VNSRASRVRERRRGEGQRTKESGKETSNVIMHVYFSQSIKLPNKSANMKSSLTHVPRQQAAPPFGTLRALRLEPHPSPNSSPHLPGGQKKIPGSLYSIIEFPSYLPFSQRKTISDPPALFRTPHPFTPTPPRPPPFLPAPHLSKTDARRFPIQCPTAL